MNDIEEVIEFKNIDKKFKRYIIIGSIVAIPSLILSFQILQKTATIISIAAYLLLLLIFLPRFISTWRKFDKQSIITEKAIFKNILFKIGSEELVDEGTKKELCKNLKQYLNNNKITDIESILKLKINYNIINFFSYTIQKDPINSYEDNFDIYNVMMLELSKEETLEKYEKIISEKNNDYNLQYSLNTFNNKLIISVLIDPNFEVLKDFTNPVAEFFKEILVEKKINM